MSDWVRDDAVFCGMMSRRVSRCRWKWRRLGGECCVQRKHQVQTPAPGHVNESAWHVRWNVSCWHLKCRHHPEPILPLTSSPSWVLLALLPACPSSVHLPALSTAKPFSSLAWVYGGNLLTGLSSAIWPAPNCFASWKLKTHPQQTDPFLELLPVALDISNLSFPCG